MLPMPIRYVWRSRWNLLRFALAVFVAWVLFADASARLGRLALAQMPDFDFAGEVHALRLEGRYGEALMLAESGLTDLEGPARATLVAERDAVIAERDSLIRRAKDVGLGALSGRGESLEGLLGAVAADMLVVGDVRDLVIQGGKQMLDGESDEVILLLSAAGIATTLLPEIDWAAAVLKAARRLGAMTERFAASLVEMLKQKDTDNLRAIFDDVRALADKASPGGAARLMRHADSPEELATLRRFVERHDGAAGALHVAGRDGAEVVKAAAKLAPDAAAAQERVLLRAARKGPAGVRFVSKGPGRVLLTPHPLLGLAKSLYKGNAAEVLERLADRMDHGAWWMLPAASAWALLEAGLLVGRWPSMRREASRLTSGNGAAARGGPTTARRNNAA
ncbi:MAG: hypothetical protein HBSAPP03_09910 [Phycisphaerae bacterium]|nr:MAG: hypothetical protein HBSAPP03_09910 [Phycisphaerae bacterium]